MGRLKKVKLNQVKSNIVESLELPRDIMYGAVIITAMGRNQVLVENYKGIIEYTRENPPADQELSGYSSRTTTCSRILYQ